MVRIDMASELGLQLRNNITSSFNNNKTAIPDAEYQTHPLFQNYLCQWAGCETPCHTTSEFLEHLLRHHGLNDKSTAQCRVQTQAVLHLETQLKKERERLSAMMAHLHSLPSKSLSIDAIFSLHQDFPESPPSPPRPDLRTSSPRSEGPPNVTIGSDLPTNEVRISRDTLQRSFSVPATHSGGISEALALSSNSVGSLSLTSPITTALPSLPTLTSIYENMLPRITSVTSPHIALASVTSPTEYEGTGECRVKNSSAPAPGSILANAALYQNPGVKPPFTYASLIREAIMNSPYKRLTLNEIYTWFSQHFSFFRYNTSQWKNAVRHNLSLHKCFQRVEAPTGSGWMVNEDEFQLRRANRLTNSNLSSSNLAGGNSRSGEESGPSVMSTSGSYVRHLLEQVNSIQESMERRSVDNTPDTTPTHPIVTSWPNLGSFAQKILNSGVGVKLEPKE
ncbi:hypothetical protein ACHWQZ_G012675 [Mnemiopsis leidyi]